MDSKLYLRCFFAYNSSMTKSIMFQGTSSNVGKSIIAAGICRILLEDGYSVAPFKAQNIALNSFVTGNGLEMGRAQVTQAAACRIKPTVYMNPVLIKPSSGTGSQVIVMGKPMGNINLHNYKTLKEKLRIVVKNAYDYLAARYDFIVLEGAGSPAEINLKKDDIVNMQMAKLAHSPVIIVGDIDRGGVFAHFAGTFDLLDPDEQKLTAGFIINKFHGEQTLLKSANEFIEKKTQRKIFGVVPMIPNLRIPDEDSVEFKKGVGKNINSQKNRINISIIDLPHISNFTDFDPLKTESDVNLFATDNSRDLLDADIIIIPGSKNTLWDMNYLRENRFINIINQCADRENMIIGICGGFQMLGKRILDPNAIESRIKQSEGLNLLDITTTMVEEKHLTQVEAICIESKDLINGYEIHHGKSTISEISILVNAKEKNEILGCRNSSGNVWGTYIHGVFDSSSFRSYILNKIRRKKKLPIPTGSNDFSLDEELLKLAAILRESIDIDAIYRLIS